MYFEPPQLANSLPSAEGVAAAAGMASVASRVDHVHPRLTSTNIDTLDASGLKTLTFTRSFATEPSAVFTMIEAGTAAPVSFRVQSWVMTGANYTGCVVYGQRHRALPAVLTLLTALVSYEAWIPAANVKFSAIMIASSQ